MDDESSTRGTGHDPDGRADVWIADAPEHGTDGPEHDAGGLCDDGPRAKGPGGREPKYRPSVVPMAREMAAGGLNYTAIARLLQVSRSTLYRWMEAHPELRDEIYMGMLEARGALLSAAMQRAQGYDYREERLSPVGEVREVQSHMPADGNLLWKLLKSLDPLHFRDRQEVGHSGAIPVQIMPQDQDL